MQWTLLCATQVPSQDPGSPRGQQCWLLLAQLLFIKGSRLTRRLERHAGFGIKGLALLISDRFSEKRLISVAERIESAASAIQRNANVNLTLVDMLSQL